jgi:hypothetical protein
LRGAELAAKEISKRELEELVTARIEAAGINRSFSIHRLKVADEKGCNWSLLAETANGWKPSELIKEMSEDVLDSIHSELSPDYNLTPKRDSAS